MRTDKICLNVFSLDYKNTVFGFCCSCGLKPTYNVILQPSIESYELCQKCKDLIIDLIENLEKKVYNRKKFEKLAIETFKREGGKFLKFGIFMGLNI